MRKVLRYHEATGVRSQEDTETHDNLRESRLVGRSVHKSSALTHTGQRARRSKNWRSSLLRLSKFWLPNLRDTW